MVLTENEKRLIELYKQYYDSYEELNSRCVGKEYDLRYCKNSDMHRGALCPSPVLDIVIGGYHRGTITKTVKDTPFDGLVYFFSKNGELVYIDNYAVFGGISELHQREFILGNELNEFSIRYEFLHDIRKSYNILSVDVDSVYECIYNENNQIMSYTRMFRSIANRDFDSIGKDGTEFKTELYTYNDKNALLDTVYISDRRDEYFWEAKYKFKHDEEGRIVSFTDLLTKPSEWDYGHEYLVAKSKQRKV